jgi:transposase-like protein
MSQNKRKQHSPQFKAKVAIEAVKSEKTIAEIASLYSVHPTLINNWKRQLLGGVSELFERGNKTLSVEAETQDQINELYRQIGQLKVERDFLAIRSAQLGLPTEKPWSKGSTLS